MIERGLHVVNEGIRVGDIRIVGVAASSVVLIGDTHTIQCASMFDTPPESLIVGPLVPFITGSGAST
ncbi:spore gernimation protein GerPD [Xylanibacillus composti]|uniref:Putative spore germination protein GerPD n=1 Tax=Xylanibacillus composti TaxID=1572762 RepID=A0A8J4M183_9BACL|nr:spore gernimation protein GerPD [Xylanibacillus composti]MDT9723941.1 spore gernimation protein GerPD [Xylanibacillus composti]GIQ67820.1 putative spore germination protein GerPD [Xylanibacillus composti]